MHFSLLTGCFLLKSINEEARRDKVKPQLVKSSNATSDSLNNSRSTTSMKMQDFYSQISMSEAQKNFRKLLCLHPFVCVADISSPALRIFPTVQSITFQSSCVFQLCQQEANIISHLKNWTFLNLNAFFYIIFFGVADEKNAFCLVLH